MLLRVALVLIGEKGIGKDSLLSYAGKMLRPTNYRNVSQPRHIVGNFNAHLTRCLLLHSKRPGDPLCGEA